VLQCVALCPLSLCMDFQKFALRCSAGLHKILVWGLFVFTMNSPKFAVYCREFQCVAVWCNGGLPKNRSLGALPFSFTTNTQNVPPHRNKHRNIRKCVRKLELKWKINIRFWNETQNELNLLNCRSQCLKKNSVLKRKSDSVSDSAKYWVCSVSLSFVVKGIQHTATHCNTLQHRTWNENLILKQNHTKRKCAAKNSVGESILQNVVSFIGLFCKRDL